MLKDYRMRLRVCRRNIEREKYRKENGRMEKYSNGIMLKKIVAREKMSNNRSCHKKMSKFEINEIAMSTVNEASKHE
jgi:hypothetical protein